MLPFEVTGSMTQSNSGDGCVMFPVFTPLYIS